MKKPLLLIVFISLSVMHAHAQVPTRKVNPGEFRSLGISKAKSKAPLKRMPTVDVKSLLVEDLGDQSSGLPARFGKAINVNIGFGEGRWEETETGSVWSLAIQSEGALSINLIFDQFYLPQGAELYIFNEQKTMVLGQLQRNRTTNIMFLPRMY